MGGRSRTRTSSRYVAKFPARSSQRSLLVSRKHTKWPALILEDPKVPLIKRQHIDEPVTLREYNDRGVGKADPEIGMLLDDCARDSDVCRRHRRKRVRATFNLTE